MPGTTTNNPRTMVSFTYGSNRTQMTACQKIDYNQVNWYPVEWLSTELLKGFVSHFLSDFQSDGTDLRLGSKQRGNPSAKLLSPRKYLAKTFRDIHHHTLCLTFKYDKNQIVQSIQKSPLYSFCVCVCVCACACVCV